MEESILEVDITKKVQYLMKYGLPGLIIIAVLCAGGIYYYQHQHKYFNVYDALVASSLVASKARTNGTITELVVADGEHVEAGDVIAHIKRISRMTSSSSSSRTSRSRSATSTRSRKARL